MLDKFNESLQNVTSSINAFQSNSGPTEKSFMERIRGHFKRKADYLRERISRRRDHAVESITRMFDRLKRRVEHQVDRSGNETTRKTWEDVVQMIDQLQEMIKHMLMSDSGQKESKPKEDEDDDIVFSDEDDSVVTSERITDLKKRIESLQEKMKKGDN